MTVTNPESTRSLSYARPFLVGFLVNVVIGYTLYFIALAQPETPPWAIGYIEQLKPTIKALDIAARISDRPFPTQVMIVYAVIGAVLLTMYYVYSAFFVTRIRQELYRRLCQRVQEVGDAIFSRSMYAGHRELPRDFAQEIKVTTKLRLKFAGMGVFLMVLSVSLFPTLFYVMGQEPTNLSPRAAAFFSPVCLLLASGIMALGVLFGLAYLCFSVSSLQLREQETRS